MHVEEAYRMRGACDVASCSVRQQQLECRRLSTGEPGVVHPTVPLPLPEMWLLLQNTKA